MRVRLGRRVIVPLAALMLIASPAAAHHVMGGRLPATFAEGLLSGLGHPVIGLDHLAFLVAAGFAVALGGLPLALPAAFVVASALGVALHVQGIGLPGAEWAVAASVILVGVLVARRARLAASRWTALFALAGVFHGYAYGESIFGAESSPLAAYLIGLVVIQAALATGVAVAVRRFLAAGGLATATRIAGVVIAMVGLAVIAQQAIAG
jgi:urease accessory protein